MRTLNAVLVVADISGYTRFVVMNRTSAAHAEEIISELMEAVTASADNPLTLQKLEGDAAFLYAEIKGSVAQAVNDVMRQVVALTAAFEAKKKELFEKSVGGCICSACQSIEVLDLKTVVHQGTVIEKSMSGLKELAGEPVIIAHRLLKNSLQSASYILVTDDVDKLLETKPYKTSLEQMEMVVDLGSVHITAYLPTDQILDRNGVKPLTRPSSYPEIIRLFVAAAMTRLRNSRRIFMNMPNSQNGLGPE